MPEYRGLVNEGSTCYLNSLLQTLFMTPDFRQNVYNYVHDQRKISTTNSIPYQLQKLFVLLQLNQNSVYTKGLLKSFQWTESDSFQQHDVQEFCRILFEALQKASKNNQWIQKLYSGIMQSVISCGKHPRANRQIFLDISLPIKNQYTNTYYTSIQQCIYEYLRPQSIQDKIECQQCGEKVHVQKCMRIASLPQILTLQVNRFQLNYQNMQREKINSFLYFPEILELSRYMVEFEAIQKKGLPKELFEKIKYVEREKSARTTDWGIGGTGLVIEGKKIQRKKSFQVQTEKKQTKFYDQENSDKRKDQTKKLSAEQQKLKNLQILKDLKADKQKLDKKKPVNPNTSQKQGVVQQQKPKPSTVKTSQQRGKKQKVIPKQVAPPSSLDDDFLFGSFMQGFDITGKSTTLNEFQDIEISNETNKEKKGPRFQKTQAIFQHTQQQYNPEKEYPKNTYILFSILVHSGGAYGGHYYAYIFDGKNWYCFNDNTVTKVEKHQIRKYGHPSQSSTSGANAYLLFYRQANSFKDIYNKPPKIPEQLLSKIKSDKTVIQKSKPNQASQQTKNRYNQIQNGLVIKIKYNGNIQTIVISDRYTQTVASLKQKVKQILNVTESQENWRIRRHYRTQDTMHEVYDVPENLQKSLHQIGLRQTCYMIVETKGEKDVFMEYDPKNIVVKINVWRDDLTLLTETYLKPIKIGIRQQKTFAQFYHKVEQILKVKSPIILKRNFSVGNPYQIFDLETNAEKTLISLRFFNGIMLYVEQKTSEKPKWEKQFQCQPYKCQIRFNNPKEGIEKSYEIFFDTRKTLGELKQRISEMIGINVQEFRIKKSQQSVSQMTNYKKRLADLKFVNQEYLHIEEGRSSKGTLLIRKGLALTQQDRVQFTIGQQFQLQIENINSTVADLKVKIGLKYNIPEFHVRVRQFKAQQFGEIFKDSQTLLKIREKSLVWEQLDIEDPKGLQIYLRVFDVMTLELGQLHSIFTEASGSYEQLALIIEEETQIQGDTILVHNPMSANIDKGTLFECAWIQIRFLQKPIRDQPLFLKSDGQILIVKKAEKAYYPKPTKKNPYSQESETTTVGSNNYKKQTGLKITVVEQKQTQCQTKAQTQTTQPNLQEKKTQKQQIQAVDTKTKDQKTKQ